MKNIFTISLVLFSIQSWAETGTYKCEIKQSQGFSDNVLYSVQLDEEYLEATADMEQLLTTNFTENIKGNTVSDFSEIDEIKFSVSVPNQGLSSLSIQIIEQGEVLASSSINGSLGELNIGYTAWHYEDDYDHTKFTRSEFQVLCVFDFPAG